MKYRVMVIRKSLYLFAILLGVVCCPYLVQSAVPVVSENGTDIIFIIDQSGSMGGSSSHPQANDPEGLRIDLLKDLVVRLFSGSSQGLAMGDTRSFRLSAIEFGDSARVGLDWFVVKAIDDQSRSEVAQLAVLRQKYCNRLDANVNLGNTNHLDAIKLAIRQLEKIDWGRDGAVVRELAVILITDGQSYVESPPYFINGSFDAGASRFRSDLVREIGELLDTKQHPKPDFVVVGLEDRLRGGREWRNSRSLWERQASEVYTVTEPDSLYGALDNLAARLTGSSSFVAGDRLEVPCYVAKLRLTVYHSGPLSQFVLKDPNGQQVQLSTRQVAKGARFRVYDMNKPIPGMWVLEGNRRSYQVRVEVHYQKTTLLTPALPDPEVPSNPLRFRWLVQTTNDEPFESKAGCQLTAITTVENSAGEIDTIPMQVDPTSTGVFEAKRDWQPNNPGNYDVQLSGRSPLASGEDMQIFGSRRIRVVVSDRQPLVGKVVTPPFVQWSLGKTEWELRVKMSTLDSKTAIPSIDDISTNSGNLITIQVFDRSGNLLQDQTALNPVPNSSPAEFIVDIELEQQYSLPDWVGLSLLEDDDLVVRFTVNQKVLNPNYGIYGFGRESFNSLDYVVESHRDLVTDLPIALTLIYILLNIIALLFELVWLGLMHSTNFVVGIKQMLLFYREDFYDDKSHCNITNRHRFLFGKIPWTILEKLFFLRSLVVRWFAHSGEIPFIVIVEHETWPLEGFAIWRSPFSREVKIRLYPLPHLDGDKAILKQENKMRETIIEVGSRRASRLPKGLGELGLDIE